MPSERLKRQIDQLLDQAEKAVAARDWNAVKDCCEAVLRVDAENEDALLFLRMADVSQGSAASGQFAPLKPAEFETGTPDLHAAASDLVETTGVSDEQVTEYSQPVEAPAQPSVPSASQPTSFANGRYSVAKFLGEGGKKKVYLAHDNTLDRDVAFALIKTDGLDEVGRERIKREAQAMGRMGTHPCIMPIYDLGEESGQPYMVQPLMGGGDVEGLIEDAEGPLELTRAVEIARQTAEGLAFAHSKGIVHRDIKPGNVWMDEDGAVKVGDFGLAVATDRSRLTVEKVMVGTVSYMPPEQATGGEVTPRADLYSLGAMMYEMAAGRPPFIGDDEIAIITQHVNTPPIAPSLHNPGIPQALDALIMRLLSKDPASRPQTADEVIQVLDDIDLSAVPVSNGTPDPVSRVTPGLFVGRREIMDRLKNSFEEVMSGRGRMAALVGEPGIGKTRTAQEIQTYAAMRGAKILWGRCHEGGGAPPYWPWVQVIRDYVATKEPDDLRKLLTGNASVISEIVPDVKARLPEVQSPSHIEEPDAARFRLFDSVAAFFRTASITDPLVVVLDDLHWADRASLLMLEYVVKELRNSRVFLIGNYRDVEINRRHPLAIALGELTREALFDRIHLTGLKEHDVRRFIEESAGIEAPDLLVNSVFAQTEGNPLFLTETVNLLVQDGNLLGKTPDRRSRSWEISIPDSVREVVGRRLDRLSEECYDVLTHAALIGRRFRLKVLESLLPDTNEDRLLDLLDEALQSRIIEESASEVGLYEFNDPMMQDALTEDLSLTRKVRFHARIADSIEAFWGSAADEHAAELAHHYELAETVLGNKKLIHYLTVAAHRALESFAYEDAQSHYSSLLEALESSADEGKKADALVGLGKAQIALAIYPDCTQNIERAFDIYVRTGATDKAIAVAKSHFPMGSDSSRMFEVARHLVPAVSPDSVDLLSRHARSLMARDPEQASNEIREAIVLAEQLNDPEQIMMALSAAASIDGMAGRWDETLAHSLRSIDLGQKYGSEEVEWLGHTWAANSFSATGQPSKADEHARQAIRVADVARNRSWRGSAMGGDARTDMFRGRWDSALKHAREGLKLDPDDSRLIAVQARIALELGDFKSIETVREFGKEPHLHIYKANLYSFAALATGNDSYAREARTRFDSSFADGIQRVDSWSAANHAWALLPVIEGDSDGANARLPQFEYWSGWVTHQGLCGDRLLGLLAETAGDPEAAKLYFEKAIEFCRAAGYKPEQAWTAVNYSELLINEAADSDPDDAQRTRIESLQDEALAIARELSMKPVTERVLSARELLKA